MEEFRGIVNIEEGRVVCFCDEQEYLQGKHPCRDQYDCPLAIINVEVVEGSCPSEQAPKDAIKKLQKNAKREVDKIKAGLGRLEAAVKKNKRFRI